MYPLDHIAILSPSILEATKVLGFNGQYEHQIETFEETRELYLCDKGLKSRLLLMEPMTPGSYSLALMKRGPGLHHIAINVSQYPNFCKLLGGFWVVSASQQYKNFGSNKRSVAG